MLMAPYFQYDALKYTFAHSEDLTENLICKICHSAERDFQVVLEICYLRLQKSKEVETRYWHASCLLIFLMAFDYFHVIHFSQSGIQ